MAGEESHSSCAPGRFQANVLLPLLLQLVALWQAQSRMIFVKIRLFKFLGRINIIRFCYPESTAEISFSLWKHYMPAAKSATGMSHAYSTRYCCTRYALVQYTTYCCCVLPRWWWPRWSWPRLVGGLGATTTILQYYYLCVDLWCSILVFQCFISYFVVSVVLLVVVVY